MAKILQLNIALKRIEPKIWRRFQVPDSITFADLHYVVQAVMGWHNYHLWQFEYGKNNPIGLPEMLEENVADARKLKLRGIFDRIKTAVHYEYDFGDGWEHTILLEKILEPDKNTFYPVCLDGARNCPPEDCGGIGGFYNLVEIMADKKHAEHTSMKEWLGTLYKPEQFNLKEINARLKAFAS
jgi:hypothetical protein